MRVGACAAARPLRPARVEFLSHGVRYAFAPERGGPTRGTPTASAAPPLNRHLVQPDPPPVWPDPEGSVRGFAFSPLYRSAPQAGRRSAALYELLALVDSRAGWRRTGAQARHHRAQDPTEAVP